MKRWRVALLQTEDERITVEADAMTIENGSLIFWRAPEGPGSLAMTILLAIADGGWLSVEAHS